MSFFPKPRNPGDAQQTGVAAAPEAGGQAELEAGPMPPFVRPGAATPRGTAPGLAAAGVVPPVAAPMYSVPPAGALQRSMQPTAALPPGEGMEEDEVAATVSMSRDTQRKVQVAVQRRSAVSASARGARGPVQQAILAPPRPPSRRPHQAFDPVAYAQAGLLNLAWAWHQSGSPIRAIHAYMQVLVRYPGTAAADAAVADLVEIADTLAEQGQFHTALSIYDQLEQLV